MLVTVVMFQVIGTYHILSLDTTLLGDPGHKLCNSLRSTITPPPLEGLGNKIIFVPFALLAHGLVRFVGL